MNYATVLNYFDKIAEAKGKLKQPLILEALKDKDFIRVIQYVLDTSRTFNVKKLVRMVESPLDQDLFEFLDYLNSKRGATAKDKNYLAAIASESEAKFTIVNKILRGKTDAGFTNQTMNKLVPGLIPYFSYMRCKGPAHLHRVKFPCYSQLKADGMYHEEREGSYRTRNGKILDFSLVPQEHKVSPEMVCELMGEITMLYASGEVMNRRAANAIINKAQDSDLSQEEADRIRFQYWDVNAGFAHQIPYKERFKGVVYLAGVNVIESKIVNNMEEAWSHYDDVRARGLEGTILKNFDGLWKDGDSMDQVKLKSVLSGELEVIGTTEGEDKNVGKVGALICRSSCGGLVTNIGMGLSDEDRERTDWEGCIIEAMFNEVSKSKNKKTYALSHARLVEERTDKTVADDLKYFLNAKEVKRK
jgi:DNA ligase-1